MLDLDPQRIDLWLAWVDEIRDADLLQRYRLLLTDEERRREQRFHFPQHRHRYLVTRALVRTVLSRYAAVAPQQWSFAPNAHGKPGIATDAPRANRISFNVSHTKGLIVLGVTGDAALGVDTEHVRARAAPLAAANAYFSSAEAAALARLAPEQRHERFFQYWTLKESYLKARGVGLSIPLDQFSFHFPQPQRVRLSLHRQLNDQPSRWRFWQFRPSPDHWLAACAERCGNRNPQLVLHKIVPLGAEQALHDLPMLASE